MRLMGEEGTQGGKGEGSRQFWEEQVWENKRETGKKGVVVYISCWSLRLSDPALQLVSAVCPFFLIKLHF